MKTTEVVIFMISRNQAFSLLFYKISFRDTDHLYILQIKQVCSEETLLLIVN